MSSCNARRPSAGNRSLNYAAGALLLFGFAVSSPAIAETVYVSDTLHVGIRAEPGTRAPSLTVVKSGAKLEAIEQKNGHTRVRASNGVEGWIKSAYLTKDLPIQAQLREAKKKISQLEDDMERAKKMQPGLAIQGEALSQTIARLERERDALRSQLANPAARDKADSSLGLAADENSDTLSLWVGVLTVFLLCLGFVLGVSWHKNQVSKRLGGLTL